MEEDSLISSPSSISIDQRRLSPRQLRSRRRFSERSVITIQEEEWEEEKQEIEPCNYENMFVETVGEHQFFRRRKSPRTPQGSFRDVDNGSFSLSNLGESPSNAHRCLRADWEEDNDEEDDYVDPGSRSRFTVREHHPCPPSIPATRENTPSTNKSLEWSQYKAILSKNFKLYNSSDVYLLAIFVIVGMLIIPYQYSFVNESQAKSYHSWNLEFPGSFDFLKTQSTDFWVKLLSGHDSLTPDIVEDLVYTNFGKDFAEAFFDTVDAEYLTSQLHKQEKNPEMTFLNFQNELLQVGRRLLRHPIPTPDFSQFVWAKATVNTAMAHFNYTGSSLGTLHIAPPLPDFEEYLKGKHSSICYDFKYSNCDVMIRVHETVDAALDYILEDIETTWALLDFTDWDKRYEIRMDPSALPSTPPGETLLANSDEYQMYYTSGFLTLQKTIDEYAFIVADRTAKDNCYRKALRQTVVSLPMPTGTFRRNTFLSSYSFLVGLACIATYLAPIAKLVLAMVDEKETKLNDMLTVAGVRQWLIDLTWLSFAACQFLVLSGLIAVLLKLTTLEFVPFWKLLLWMIMTGVTTASFSFSFGIVFKKARLAAALAPALFLATTLPRFLVFGIQQDAKTFHSWVGLFPGSAVCFGVDSLMGDYKGEHPEQSVAFFTVILYLLFDSIIVISTGLFLAHFDIERVVVKVFGLLGYRQGVDDASVASHPSTSTPNSVR